MWTMILSLQPFVEELRPAFTQPSFGTAWELLLAWVMCLGKHTLYRVAQTTHPDIIPDRSRRHGLDSYYNFFERSAWKPRGLAQRIANLLLTTLQLLGVVTLLVDDTLAHKRGKSVWGLGWFRVAVAVCVPFTNVPILALPLLARLHLPGAGQPSCADLAREMLAVVLEWFGHRRFTLVADGAYAAKGLLGDLDGRVTFVGRLRGDAAVYDPRVPAAKKGQRGPKAKKGRRLPAPVQAAAKADRKRSA